MAKRKSGKGGKNGGGRKVTKGDAPRPPTLEVVENVIDARAELEKRRRAAIAKAALELDHVDGEILRLMLQYPKITQEAIGDAIGLSRKQVNGRINAPKFQNALQVATRSALEIFESNKARAARKLGSLLDSKDEHIAIRAAIAHMWPHIHGEAKDGSASDFVTFIQEAYELANAKNEPPAKASGEK